MKRRIWTLLLALALVLTMLPTMALAGNGAKGTEANPYTLAELGAMTRADYIAAQNALGGTMYVDVGTYSYETNGTLGNGVRDDTPGQQPDHSKLNAYGENGYLNEKNDGANGKNIVFVGGTISSDVTGYASIDNIGTSLLLAVPAYTNVTFKNTMFNNVMSFNYQLYTSPWSQLGELKFEGCTFNGIIVGSLAAQTLTFRGCTFTDYTNTARANNSNPTWIRPAYGNWTPDDNKGQGSDFRSLTTINFENNQVTSTRPVKFENISQWDMTTTVTATGNTFDISAQPGDTSVKNVGLYLGAHTDQNAFNLTIDNNQKTERTAGILTLPEGKTSLPEGSVVRDSAGNLTTVSGVAWKAGTEIEVKTTYAENAVAEINGKGYTSVNAAIADAKAGDTVKLLKNVTENVTIPAGKEITLDLDGKVLSGGTTASQAALLNNGTVTIKDSSEAKTGMIRREDNNAKGYYVIDNQGTMTIESGSVYNATGTMPNGSSLIRNAGKSTPANLTINGGHIKQDGFIAIKNDDHGILTINDGLIETSGDTETNTASAVQNWSTATINGGTINGTIWVGVWSNDLPNSVTTIKNATVNGKIVVKPYGSSLTAVPTLKIESGKYDVTGWDIQDNGAVLVSGGTFTKEVDEKYLDENVKAVLKTREGGKSLYTYFTSMDEAIQAAQDTEGSVSNPRADGNKEVLVTLYCGYNRAAIFVYAEPGASFKLPTLRNEGEYVHTGWQEGSTVYAAGASYTVTKAAELNAVWSYNGVVVPVTPSEPAKNPFNENAGKNSVKFDDVADNAWYTSAVNYVVENGLMNGTGSNKFSPNANTTRGMIVTILARLNGKSTAGTPWYEAGRRWAMVYEISDGTNMTSVITREQLVTMLYRYAVKNGLEAVTLADNLSQFTDASSVSSWAVPAMQWAVGSGLMQGSNGQLRPQDNASRAEVAAMLMRFCAMMNK